MKIDEQQLTIAELEDSLEASRRRISELENEITAKNECIHALKERNKELIGKAENMEREAEASEARCEAIGERKYREGFIEGQNRGLATFTHFDELHDKLRRASVGLAVSAVSAVAVLIIGGLLNYIWLL